MKLTVESALKNHFMKEQVMLTEAEWSLQRGHFDYWIYEDCGKVGIAVTSKTWEDLLGVSVSLHHEEERSYWLVEATFIDIWEEHINYSIELPATLVHTAQDVGHKVGEYFSKLPDLVGQVLTDEGEDVFTIAGLVKDLNDIKAEKVQKGWAVR
ncbi:hypothetical protein ACMG4J_02485 [Rossellomorea marisflavi]|uniref:hypothetical protein n=1 Tax=Rossellomorea marisflavi TaxID=189381 RepID=UPI0039BF9559